MLKDATLAYGEEMTRALLGVDALSRDEGPDASGTEVGLVALNLDAAGRHAPETFGNWAEARVRLVELKAQATGLHEADRRAYFDDLCHATLAFAEWRDRGLPFAARLRDFLRVPDEPASDTELGALRSEMRELLDAMGYRGDLADQCATWEQRNRVAAADAAGALATLLDEAWDRTHERLLAIPGQKNDRLRVRVAQLGSLGARSDHPARTLEIDLDAVFTRPGLKYLAAREGYPGHDLQLRLREALYDQGEATADVLLGLTGSAGSAVFEGIADTGPELVDWVETNDDRLQGIMNRYRAGLCTGAAWLLHARRRPGGDVRAWLRDRALWGGDSWVEARVAEVALESRSVVAWSRWWGQGVVAPAWRKLHEARRPDFLRYLYGRMHSSTSLGMFH